MINGIGPYWFPENWREKLTEFVWFMKKSSWVKHDVGYGRNYPPRKVCDILFYAEMVRDSYEQKGKLRVLALCISLVFYILVRCLGWISWLKAKKELDKKSA